MSTIIDYDILQACSLIKLIEKVKAAMKDEWEPMGAITASESTGGEWICWECPEAKEHSFTTRYWQTMVKYASLTVNVCDLTSSGVE